MGEVIIQLVVVHKFCRQCTTTYTVAEAPNAYFIELCGGYKTLIKNKKKINAITLCLEPGKEL